MHLKKYLFLIACLFVIKNVTAQNCNGSLGDPIVNVTFGSGANFGPPLASGTISSLQYQGDICPWDGNYAIVNYTTGCWANDVVWHTATDHTGNSNGYYMLVNASYDPSNFYIQTVSGLCPGTTYQFAAWLLNMCSVTGIKPNITFTIEKTDGTILGKYDTGDIPIVNPATWAQYGLYFTTPVGVSTVVLRMRNNSPGGVGNDLGLDDITFRPAGANVTASITGNAADTINICEGDASSFHFESIIENCYANTAYQWQVSIDNGAKWTNIPGATSSAYTRMPTTAGKYLYRLNVAESINIGISTCRVSSNLLGINITPLPLTTAANNSPKCSGDSVLLTASGGAVYDWTGPGAFSDTGSHVIIRNIAVAGAGKYFVKVTSAAGCTKLDSTIIAVYPSPVAAFNTSSPFCERGSISFIDQSVTNGEPLNKWTWDFGDGAAATTNNATHVFTNASTYQVSLSVENSKGCKSNIATKIISIHPLPHPDFLMPAICLTDPFASFINASSINDNSENQFLYQWSFGDGNATPANNASTIKSPQHAYSSVGIYPVNLIVTSNNGCVKDTTKNFTVNGSQPVAKFTVDPAVSLCSNEDVIITDASSVNFGSIARVEIYWDFLNQPAQKIIDSFPSPGKIYTHRYPEFGSPITKDVTVRYVVYSGISCVNEIITKLTIKASPAVQFASLASVCAAAPSFTVTQAHEINGLAGAGIYSGAGINAAGLFNPQLATAGDHIIRYTFSATNGCTAFAEESITVFDQPVANAGPDRVVLLGGSTILNASATGNNLLYEWSPIESIENSQVATPTIFPAQNTTYTMKVVSADGCEDTDQVFVTVVKDIFVPSAFSPNGDGTNDVWRIPFLDSYSGSSIQVFNRYGEIVFQSKDKMIVWDGMYKGEPVPIGSYIWVLNPGNGRKQMHGTVTVIR